VVSWLETAIVGSHDSWVVAGHGSRGSRVKKCDPLSSLLELWSERRTWVKRCDDRVTTTRTTCSARRGRRCRTAVVRRRCCICDSTTGVTTRAASPTPTTAAGHSRRRIARRLYGLRCLHCLHWRRIWVHFSGYCSSKGVFLVFNAFFDNRIEGAWL